jgi:proline iminopeptidase
VTVRPGVSEHFLGSEFFRYDLTDRLGLLHCPVLLLTGNLDPIVTVDDAEELFAALPATERRFVRFPNAGHGLIGEHEAVLQHIHEFVLDQPG